MISYLRIELKKFFTNRKNIMVYVLIALAALFYALRVAPNYDPIEKVSYEEMQAAHDTRLEFLNSRKGKNNLDAHPAVRHALFQFISWNKLDKKRMQALDNNDLVEYTKVTNQWYLFAIKQIEYSNYYYYNPRYYTYGNPDGHEQGHLSYLSTAIRYGYYIVNNTNITIDVLEERTANQTVYRLLEGYLPYVFYFGCLLLTIDIVLQDRRNPTLLKGFPILDWRKIIAKGLTAFSGSIALIVPMLIAYFIIAFQSGFGSLQLPIPILIEKDYKPHFDAISLGSYYLQTGTLILGWFAVIISFVLLLSVAVRQEIVNILAGAGLILSERLYIEKGLAYIKPVESYLPTYFEVSKVVTNVKNYFYDTDLILYSKGMTLLITTAAVLMLLTIAIAYFQRSRLIK